ncbi:MAG: tRNA 4-thiouridine(8) synthase ThiI, partial [Clostridia bacterium]|nr:tRNA 4-thiouridine(8) synthase ThiI [Clostridia bacterium]
YPHTSEFAMQKLMDIAGKLTNYCSDIKLFIIKFTDIQQAIHEYCREDYMITIMRRIMAEIAEKIALKNHCGALITGESLAQVASQTTKSITVTNEAVKSLPVFRPLIGMDKYEIMETAEKIDTYAISELPYEDCCTVFLPKNPVIKPDLEIAKKEQAKIVGLDRMIDEAIESVEIMTIKPEY